MNWLEDCYRRGIVCLALCGCISLGCGTIRKQLATEQLLLSDAVDRCVAQLDFAALTGEKLYLDSRYLRDAQEGQSLVNSNYVISSLRQQMLAAGCLVQDRLEDATYVVEARVGTLGSDGHEVNYGLPASNFLSSAATLVSGAPSIPALPEVSLARRRDDSAVAKIGLFAYHRETKRPVWQSGLSIARSHSQDRWIFGAGPFQSGTIHQGTMFAGGSMQVRPFGTSPQREEISSSEGSFRAPAILDPALRQKLDTQLTAQEPPPSETPQRLPETQPDTTLASHDAAE